MIALVTACRLNRHHTKEVEPQPQDRDGHHTHGRLRRVVASFESTSVRAARLRRPACIAG